MLGTIETLMQMMLVEKREEAVGGSTRTRLAEARVRHLESLDWKFWLSESATCSLLKGLAWEKAARGKVEGNLLERAGNLGERCPVASDGAESVAAKLFLDASCSRRIDEQQALCLLSTSQMTSLLFAHLYRCRR